MSRDEHTVSFRYRPPIRHVLWVSLGSFFFSTLVSLFILCRKGLKDLAVVR